MYETKAKGTSYSTRVGKKSEEVKAGCFVIEHVPTGRFLAGVSASVSEDVQSTLLKVKEGKGGALGAMRWLADKDPDLRIVEYPTRTLRQAQTVLKEIQDTVEPKYLLLGDNSVEKKRCPAKVKSKPVPCEPQPMTKSLRKRSTSPKT